MFYKLKILGKQSNLMVMDLSMAFDSIPHRYLVVERNCYGVHGALISVEAEDYDPHGFPPFSLDPHLIKHVRWIEP